MVGKPTKAFSSSPTNATNGSTTKCTVSSTSKYTLSSTSKCTVSNTSKILVVLIVVLLLFLFLTDQETLGSLSYEKNKQKNVYDLQAIDAPRLSGWALRVFSRILHLPLIGKVFTSLLLRENQIIQVRELAAKIPDLPLYYPFIEPTTTTMTTTTNEFSVEDFLQQGHDGKCPLRRSTSKKPTTENFRYWSIADYLACYKLKELTPLQVAKAILQAIDASEKRKIPLRAFLQINRPQLLQEAKESTKRYQENQLKGPLDGIPVAIKDEMLVKEHALTFGTNFYGQKVVNFSTVDATAVQRLRDAGTMIIGTTNMFELGTGTSGFNLHHGTPRNPYDPETYTGGSSSGSAVAVASGLVPLALGVDGGGSVRIPSTLCGIVGLKATFQRIPSISEGAPSVSNIGPMASNVKDTAIGYAILSGPHEAYPRSFMQPNIHFQDFEATQDLKGIRIGIFSEYVNDSAPIVRETFWQSVEFLKKRGAIIKETQLHHLNAIHRAHLVTITTELSFFMDKFYTDHLKDHAAEVQLVFSFGRALSAMDFLAAQKIRQFALRQLKEQVFNQVDVFMTPGVAVTSPKIPSDALSFGETDAKLISAFMKYVVLGNLVGIPGIVVPVGYSHGGEGQKGQLPIGVQFQSLHWQEDVIFRLANTIEKEFTTKKRPFPQVFYDILTTSQSF